MIVSTTIVILQFLASSAVDQVGVQLQVSNDNFFVIICCRFNHSVFGPHDGIQGVRLYSLNCTPLGQITVVINQNVFTPTCDIYAQRIVFIIFGLPPPVTVLKSFLFLQFIV